MSACTGITPAIVFRLHPFFRLGQKTTFQDGSDYSGCIQDEISSLHEKHKLKIGRKIETPFFLLRLVLAHSTIHMCLWLSTHSIASMQNPVMKVGRLNSNS